jgi:hypothetical protein
VQVSVVHASPSLQSAAAPHAWIGELEQVPPAQVSAVPAIPSSQSALVAQHPGVGVYELEHPVAGEQESVVQALLSVQMTVEPPAQFPRLQDSPNVQALPSLHALALAVWAHAFAVQASSVQTLASLQSAAVRQQPAIAPCWQRELSHVSAVQGLASSQSLPEAQLVVVENLCRLPVVEEAPSETTAYHS